MERPIPALTLPRAVPRLLAGSVRSLAERSLAYEKMLRVQQASFGRFEEVGRIMPAYYDHFAHYRLSYPETGWSDGPLLVGTPVYITPGEPWRDLENMPGEFVMLLEAEWLGGEHLADIKRRAGASPEWSVESEIFEDGEFRSEVIIVRRLDSGAGSEENESAASPDAFVWHPPDWYSAADHR